MNKLLPVQRHIEAQLEAARQGGAQGQYLTLLIGAELCAVSVLVIKEIIEYAGVTVVPMMPAYVRGIINLRGAVVPVIDPLARFGRGQAALTRKTCIVIVETPGGPDDEPGVTLVRGLVVDAVNAVMEIDGADIEPAPAFGARIRHDFIAGMARMKGRQEGQFVMLLALDKVLEVDEQEAAQSAPALLA
ncbi:MAG: chemotaxis protein CheW [Pseudomonadota bacterium]